MQQTTCKACVGNFNFCLYTVLCLTKWRFNEAQRFVQVVETTRQTDKFDLITKNRNTMKSLIRKMSFAICTLLLTCTFCLAQNTSNAVYITKTVKLCNDSTELKSVGVDTLMVQLMVEYEIECYNDSMEVITHECPDNITGCLVYHTWYKTIHKEPTFKDFVRWAAKKYGL